MAPSNTWISLYIFITETIHWEFFREIWIVDSHCLDTLLVLLRLSEPSKKTSKLNMSNTATLSVLLHVLLSWKATAVSGKKILISAVSETINAIYN